MTTGARLRDRGRDSTPVRPVHRLDTSSTVRSLRGERPRELWALRSHGPLHERRPRKTRLQAVPWFVRGDRRGDAGERESRGGSSLHLAAMYNLSRIRVYDFLSLLECKGSQRQAL